MNQSIISTELQDLMIQWRHDFHIHPELGGHEQRTADVVADLLESFGLDVYRKVGGHGVVGVLKCGKRQYGIGLRADMDALAISEQNTFDYRSVSPGRMHACGHDGHMAMLLGAAKYLAEKGQFDGQAHFIFQPAEEPGVGARAMMNDGLFSRFIIDAVYGMHNMPSLPQGILAVRSGPVMACEDHFEIRLNGQGTHAALPHQGKDLILAGSNIVTALQSIVSRTLNPVDNAVLSVTEFIADGTTNVLPNNVILKGDARSFLPSVQEQIETSMKRIVQGIAEANGVDGHVSYSHEFAATINTDAESVVAAEVARQLVGEEKVLLDFPPFMASEDFGAMLEVKPGCFLFIGNGSDAEQSAGLHNPAYDFNDANLTLGAEFWARLVETQLPIS
jgi:amidohydrolase